MKFLAYLRSLTAKVVYRSQVSDDMEDELRSHIQHRADDLERSGLHRAEAERRARIEFGGHGRFKEECQEALGGNFIETLAQDARFSLRVLRKSPGFTIAAVLTLALAIGANAVVFGIMDGLILRPLNVPQAESLWGTLYGVDPGWQSYPNYLDLRDRNHSFAGLAAWKFVFVGLDKGNNPSLATGYATSGNYFDVLRVQPYLGRLFHSSDEHGPNSAPYLVLSYAYWHSRFQDDRGVVGRVIQIDKHPFTVIGVAPPDFRGTLLFASPDFFMPIVNQGQVDGENLLDERSSILGIFEAFGHLKPGVTPAQAEADVKAVGAALEKTYPKEVTNKNSSLAQEGLTSFSGPVREFVAGLMLLAGLILLAACANLGSLFSARAADRAREVALRLALGSSRSRIMRGLLTEAVLISLVGGTIGLLGSVALLRQLSVWQPFPGAPIHLPVSPDAKVYVIALVLALVSGFLFGMVPVRQVLRTDPYQIIKAGSSGRLAGKFARRLTVREVLLALQIAICAVLVTSSLVAVRGLVRSLHSNFGFEPRNTLVVGATLAMAGYSGDQVPAMQKRIIDALKTIPEVERVGLVNNYPPLVYTAAFRANVFKQETTDLRPSHVAFRPYRYDISPGYFQAAGTTLLAGRDVTWHDDKNAPPVAVVNREFAGRIFGKGVNAVGRYFKLQDGARVQVVGVVEDGKYLSLTEDQEPAMFLPFLRSQGSAASILVRSTLDPQRLAGVIRSKVRELDAGLPVDTQTWNSMLSVVLFPARVATMSLGVLGVMGAMLSITGIFGMAAYSVSKRLKELGIRVALGAQRKEVLQAALGRAFKLLAFGSAAGLVLGILASRVLASIVYQASPRDPLVLAGVVLAMALLGLLATWIPAQRALSLDPMRLLRSELALRMKLLAYFRWLTARFFCRSQVEDDMEQELLSHIQHRAEDLERGGLDPAAAERRARIEFGGYVRFKEESHEAIGSIFFETLMQDVRFAFRVLRKSRGFTIAAISTLALAIGANAVVFSVLNGVILRPLNVPQAQSLYGIERVKDRMPTQSYPDYIDLRDRNRSFDGLAAYDIAQAALDAGGNPSRLWGVEASGNYFDALRIQPYLGRVFHGSDEHGPNSAPYLVLSYAYWHSHFGDDRAVVGRVVRLNKHPFTIVGVAPPGFQGTLLFVSPDFFVPPVDREQVEGDNDLTERGSRWLFMAMGHLKAGVTPAQAVADLNSIGSYLEKTYPKAELQMRFSLVRPSLLGDNVGGPVRAFLVGLMLLAELILLAACANLGSLFAARAADRSREVALRLALGASRSRILRGLFTEAVLISLAGGAVGLWGSILVLRWLSVWQPFPRNFPVHTPVNPDATVYGVALLLTLASGFLFGAVPVRQVLHTDPYQVIKSGSTARVGRRMAARDLLVAVQIAICAVLVTSSLVAVRGLARSLHSHFGFEPQNAMLVDTDLHMAGYSGDRVPAMQRRMVDALKAIPGVKAVGLTDGLLLDDGGNSIVFADRTTDLRAAKAAADATMYHISPEYLQAEGTALLSGRTFTWHDDKNAPRVAVINKEFARKIFGPVASALGGYYKMPDGTRVQVVGVAEDGKYNSLTEDPQPAMFLPILQWPSSQTWLVVRSHLDPQQLGAAIRSRLRQLDAGLPVYIATRYRELDAVLFGPRMATISLSVLGVMGAMLSITGILGWRRTRLASG